ncbi:hypothetical protein NDU88_006839 [Pleurodeles waltl]|uniref:Uncharacterized protein n=1 Tax=Pleurodeles waltl TaxID=8319 RepID=A0AAV7X4Y7_PLEWA|nr:hypothetical protein NDU88_006839 [Pleurodeles waltl]
MKTMERKQVKRIKARGDGDGGTCCCGFVHALVTAVITDVVPAVEAVGVVHIVAIVVLNVVARALLADVATDVSTNMMAAVVISGFLLSSL